tara:strand:+ start:3707 stop:4042 length:336 start_codon:yes stop_codon:yes gene_type:complete
MPLRQKFLPETATIQTVSDTNVDERGLPSDSWANTYTNVKCKFESQGAEEDRDGRNTTTESFMVYVEKGVSVTPGDRLVRGSDYHEITMVQPVLDRYGVECYKRLLTFVAK